MLPSDKFPSDPCSRPVATERAFGSSVPQFFVPPQILLCQKNLFSTYTKSKNLASLKMFLLSQTSKPGYGPAMQHVLIALQYKEASC